MKMMLYKRDGHLGIEFIPENIKKIINEEVTICLNSVFATLYTRLPLMSGRNGGLCLYATIYMYCPVTIQKRLWGTRFGFKCS